MNEGDRSAEVTGVPPGIGAVTAAAGRLWRLRPLLLVSAAVVAATPVFALRRLADRALASESTLLLVLPIVFLALEFGCGGALAAMVTAATRGDAAAGPRLGGIAAMARALGRTLGVQFGCGLRIWGGMWLLVLPGLYEATRLFVAVPAAVVERVPLAVAAQRSQALVRGRSWMVLGLWILPTLIWAGAMLVASRLHVPFYGVWSWGITVVVMSLRALLQTAAYWVLRGSREAIDVDAVARTFD